MTSSIGFPFAKRHFATATGFQKYSDGQKSFSGNHGFRNYAVMYSAANFGQRASKLAFPLFSILVYRGLGVRHKH
jgi:hypothetical protein